MNWLGKSKITDGGAVLYISAEDPDESIHQRVYGIAQQISTETGIGAEDLFKICSERLLVMNLFGNVKPLFSKGKEGVQRTSGFRYIKEVMDCIQPKLVVIDPKARFSGLDENDNAVVAQEVAGYEALKGDSKMNLIMVHHVNKSAVANPSTPGGFRGASSFFDSLRVCFNMIKLSPNQLADLNISRDRGIDYLALENTKQNYCQKSGRIIIRRDGFRFECIQLEENTDLEEELENFVEHIMDLISENAPYSVSGLKKAWGEKVSDRRVRRAVNHGIQEGKLVQLNGRVKSKSLIDIHPDYKT